MPAGYFGRSRKKKKISLKHLFLGHSLVINLSKELDKVLLKHVLLALGKLPLDQLLE